MLEQILITARSNPHIDPVIEVWGWQISVYLFFGGLTAGIMLFAAIMVLLRREQQAPFATNRLALLGPIALSLGMTTLFLDLSVKLHVFRFYTTFEPTSPMSYGAWILIFVYPISILQILSTLRPGFPMLAGLVDDYGAGRWLLDLCERFKRPIAALTIPIAVSLGIYTGILLSAFSARPFWNSGLLGPLFLVSGLSTAAALTALIARETGERHLFTRLDLGLILVELALVALLLVNLATGPAQQLEAVAMLFGGSYTFLFWGLFVTLGLLIPLLIEYGELHGVPRRIALLGPVLVLLGGYMLRVVVVDLGQETTWVDYTPEYNSTLLQRLADG